MYKAKNVRMTTYMDCKNITSINAEIILNNNFYFWMNIL